MTKVNGTISQLGVAGSISQKNISGSISQKCVSGSITEGGYVVTATIPAFISAVVADDAPTKVILTYSQSLDTGSVPATTDFTVTDHTISGVAISGSTVELTLSTAVIYFDILYVTYTKGANPIQGLVGGLDAADLASTLITNNVLEDGTTFAWYLASDLTTITKDGSNYVSRWNDKLGSGHDLIQSTGTNQPLWVSSNYISCDGIDNFIQTALTDLAQPVTIYAILRQPTWTFTDRIWDGANVADMYMLLTQYSDSPELLMYAGAGSSLDVKSGNLAVNTWGILRCVYNGANSSLQINSGAKVTGSLGAPAYDKTRGFTFGCRASGAEQWANVEGKEIIIRAGVDTDDFYTSLYNVIKRRAGL